MSGADLPRGRVPAAAARSGHNLGVALVDQVPLFRDGLQALLANTPSIRLVGATQNMHAAAALCERFRPDVVLVDVVLDPRGHLARLLISANPTLAVISLVREPYRSAYYVSEALAGGIHGLLLRAADPSQFVEAIRRTHSERRYLDPSLSVVATGVAASTKLPGRQSLSRREYQVLQLIAEGLENQAIGKTLFVSVETVRTHVKSILRKLHARDRAHAVALAFRTGVLATHGRESITEGGRPRGAGTSDRRTPKGERDS